MRKQKLMKTKEDKWENTVESLCKTLKFRTKKPKIIDLTVDDEKMPETLNE